MTTTLTLPYGEAVDVFKRLALTSWTRPIMPVLRCALLDGVAITSTELENWTCTPLPEGAAVGDPVLIPVHATVKALRAIKGSTSLAKARAVPVTITVDGAKVTLSGFGRTLTIDDDAPNVPDDFPSWPSVKQPAVLATFEDGQLPAALAFVESARGSDDTLPMLTGVRLEGVAGVGVDFATTDRYRLAVTTAKADTVEFATLLNGASVKALRALTGDVRLVSTDNLQTLWFTGSNGTVSVRALDCSFPPFRSLLPTDPDLSWTVPRKPLLDELKIVSPFVAHGKGVVVKYSPDGLTPKGGSTVNTVDSRGDGYGVTGFTPGYLIDGLASFGSEQVTLSVTSFVKPHVITGQRPDGGDATYLIMPVRLTDEERAAA